MRSITAWTRGIAYRVLVINNGVPASCSWIDHPLVDVLEAEGNLGWTGGLALGLDHCDEEFVCFLNDDTLIVPSERYWLKKLHAHFSQEEIGAVGPASNCTSGIQSIFQIDVDLVSQAPLLVGFCMLVRRQALDECGGVDPSLPGGDDIDLSIRLRQKNYSLLCDRSVFVYHHGFITGRKVYGPQHMPGGWNSREYAGAAMLALLAKHGAAGLELVGIGVERCAST